MALLIKHAIEKLLGITAEVKSEKKADVKKPVEKIIAISKGIKSLKQQVVPSLNTKKVKDQKSSIPIKISLEYHEPQKKVVLSELHFRDASVFSQGSAKSPKPEFQLEYFDNAELAWHPPAHANDKLLKIDWANGTQINVGNKKKLTDREMVIGVDFGTSSTKVVIADRSSNVAYAVPFTDGVGVMSYLLPTLLIEHEGKYLLEGHGKPLNDLKLSVMADPDNIVHCARVSAYLALVIQYARAWLFKNHLDAYRGSEIFWTLALGQPADQATSSSSKALFRQLGQVAWALAADTVSMSTPIVLNAWKNRDQNMADTNEFHCLVMPELAAQIHGYINSESFDNRLPNIFLMVDVGAGTVDASVFHVKKQETGVNEFSLFSNSVEVYGVANLHRHRVDWWLHKLADSSRGKQCANDMKKIKLPTEYRGFFPESFSHYVKGVIDPATDPDNPDDEFFKKIRTQLVGKILSKAKSERKLRDEDINGMPFFLCGGGARHLFYERRINAALQKSRGSTWLNLAPKELSIPSKLLVEGVKRSDYDRLSVAYGLSQLELFCVKYVEAMIPDVAVDQHSNWSANYVDKASC